MQEGLSSWAPEQLPEAGGRTFVVTGGNAGIGYFISEQLAGAGAAVVLASRSRSKAELAIQAVQARMPGARLRFHALDLSDLASARRSGAELAGLGRIDGIVLNAALLSQRERRTTADGHELVFGTNHYGNAQFVAAALPQLLKVEGARLVTMGSVAQRVGRVDLDDLEQARTRYRGFRAYGTSKQAQMLLALELDRRLIAAGAPLASLIAHPGGALDGLTPDRPPAFEQPPGRRRRAALLRPFVQGKDRAAWPAVRALLDPDARGGQVWGPGDATGRRPPKLDPLRGAYQDAPLAAGLWRRTETVLRLDWPI